MYEMVTSDRCGIPVSHDRNYFEGWIGQFYTGGKGKCSAVRSMQSIEVHIGWQPARTPYPRDEDNVVLAISIAIDGPDERAEQDTDTTSRTPDVREYLG
jgi:hypothetical protein